MSDILTKGIMVMVFAVTAGYMFGPAIQGWILANVTGSGTSLSWLSTTVMPILIGVSALMILVYGAISKKR